MTPKTKYEYLEHRPEKATKHLCIKGRNMTVWSLIGFMRTEKLSPEEVAANANLPVEAVYEAIEYFEDNKESILAENEQFGKNLGLVK